MLFSELPYDIILHVCSFIHTSDLVSLATSCSHIHSCLEKLLAVHQRKLATLSSIHDTNRVQIVPILRNLLLQGSDFEDVWYFREVVISSYRSDEVRCTERVAGAGLLPGNSNPTLSFVAGCVGLPRILANHHNARRPVDELDAFLILALLKMPRLSALRISPHPSHGNSKLYGRGSPNGQLGWYTPRVYALEVLITVVTLLFTPKSSPRDAALLLPALKGLKAIEIEEDELQDLNQLGYGEPAFYQLRQADLRPLFNLPRLKRLTIHRHKSSHVRSGGYKEPVWQYWDYSGAHSSVEELILVGFGGWQEVIRNMLKIVKRLRLFVLQQRGREKQLGGILQALQECHHSSLETVVLPLQLSNTLSWCQPFGRLKHVTLSYVDIMEALRGQQISSLVRNPETATSSSFHLATRLPSVIEVLSLVGGRQSNSATSVRPIPLYNDIQDFLDVMVTFVSERGVGPGGFSFDGSSKNLRDICFGDMRVAIAPEDRAEGKRLHESFTKSKELLRLKLNYVIERSGKLSEACNEHGVRLHTTNLKTRECNHASRHPYVAKRPLSKQELLAKAERMGQNADAITRAVLAQYTEKLFRTTGHLSRLVRGDQF